jgi:hypothetical protein
VEREKETYAVGKVDGRYRSGQAGEPQKKKPAVKQLAHERDKDTDWRSEALDIRLTGVMSKPKTFPYIPRGRDGNERILPNSTSVKPESKSRGQGQNKEESQERITVKLLNP